MDPKIGCYICKGCDIAKSLDVDKLVGIATGEGKVAICKTHDMFCGSEGVEIIKNQYRQ